MRCCCWRKMRAACASWEKSWGRPWRVVTHVRRACRRRWARGAVVAVTGDDEDNLVICQLAKARFRVKRTIARVNNPRNDDLFLTLGIDVTISPTRTILHQIEAEIPHHTLVPLMTLTRAGMRLVEVTVPPDSPAAGKTLAELRLPSSVNVALII